MSDVTTRQFRNPFGWAAQFGTFVSTVIGQAFERPVVREEKGVPPVEDHVADLLYKIDHGFIVEETGERARLPRFARTHLKASIRHFE